MKIIKWLLVIMGIIVLVIGFIVMDPFSQRPFKFEDIDTIVQGQAFLEHRYPPSSDLSYVLEDLKKAEAECVNTPLNVTEKEKEYTRVIRCVYRTGWLSKAFLAHYITVIYVADNNKIKKLAFNIAYMGP